MKPLFHGWISPVIALLRTLPLSALVLWGAAVFSSSYALASVDEVVLQPADIAVQDVTTPSPAPVVVRDDRRTRSPRYEHILAFDSLGVFDPDGTMTVTETIKVYAAGNQIRRGIFRTLPLTWNRQDGKIFSVAYQVQQVLRNGEPEAYSEKREGKELTIRIGDAGRMLPRGEHTYVIRYQVINHFSRFPEWDELYWNVTGNGWPYDIDSASFRLMLPDAAAHTGAGGRDERLRSIDVYTGYAGAKEMAAEILADGSVRMVGSLRERQGMTVVYTWPRAILAGAPAPEAASPWRHYLLPTEKNLVLWLPVMLLAAYYLIWWYRKVVRTGLKMPPVIPLYDTPQGMTPGFVRFVADRGYDDVGFSSDLLDLVARRAIAFDVRKKTKAGGFFASLGKGREEQWISPLPQARAVRLDTADQQLLNTLFSGKRKSINLSQAYQRPMQKAREMLEKRYQGQRKALFNRWAGAMWLGIFIFLLVPILCAVFFDPGIGLVTIPIILALLLGLSILSWPVRALFSPGKSLRRGGCASVFFSLIFGLPLVGGVVNLLFSEQWPLLPAGYPGALLSCLMVLMFFIIRAPRYTQQGLNALAAAQGLKRYLSAAEEHRFETLYPPDKLVTHFERMLPYALALGVGKTWADTFSGYLISSGSMSEVFAGGDWGHVRSFSDSCRTSSSPTPSSNSGGGSSGSSYSGSGSSGGGSSGGGSGGGGGGGW